MNQLHYSETGKVREIKEEEDHISIGLDYDSFGSQYGSFPKLKGLLSLFPVGEKVKALFDSPDPWCGRKIKGLRNSMDELFLIDPKWEKEFNEKRHKKWEEQRKKEHERMMAIPRHRYESKYQFPNDIDIYGNTKENGEGFRNSSHLSVSRGMEFLEGKDVKDFEQHGYLVRELENHIDTCIEKELGVEWTHSGASMSLAISHVLKAKELGWNNYIEWVRSWNK